MSKSIDAEGGVMSTGVWGEGSGIVSPHRMDLPFGVMRNSTVNGIGCTIFLMYLMPH